MKEVRYHKLNTNTVIGSKDKPTTWDVGLWSLATLKDTFFSSHFLESPPCFLEKCLTSNQPNGILVDSFDQGFPHGWLHHQSGSLVTLRLLCLALVTWCEKSEGKLVIEITDSLGFPEKGFFLQVFSGILLFFLWDLYIFLLEMLESCFPPFEWMLCVCVCAFKGFLKAVSSTSTPLRVVNATFFDLADFYQFLGWPSNVFFFVNLRTHCISCRG